LSASATALERIIEENDVKRWKAFRKFAKPAAALLVVTAIPLAFAQPAQAASCITNFKIKSVANGDYASVELNYTGGDYGMLRARAGSAGPWETFTYCDYGSYFTLMSNANNDYVSAEVGDAGSRYGMLRARSASVGPWEKFIKHSSSATWSFQSAANLDYVSVEMNYTGSLYGMLRARSSSPGPWEYYYGVA
jgi:hypothetical protein